MSDDSPILNNSTTTSWTSPGAGITAGYDGSNATYRIFVIFLCGLAMYNAVELFVMIVLTFKRYQGLYFWSMLISAAGIIPYSIGFLLKFLDIVPQTSPWLAIVLLTIGWWPMITGQAVVLWSRLHLIVSGEKGDRILHWTKWMIIINVIIFHIPTTILTFGANGSLFTHTFVVGYNVMEKIQMVGFFLQEVTLSSIYIVETVKILQSSLQPQTRTTMKQLILINALIIFMDLALLGLECASLYIIETLIKGVIYSIKLKLEFAILGKLVKFVGGNHPQMNLHQASLKFGGPEEDKSINIHDFVDLNHVRTNLVQPSRPSASSGSRRRSTRPDAADFDFDIARFEHSEDVATLSDMDFAPCKPSKTTSTISSESNTISTKSPARLGEV